MEFQSKDVILLTGAGFTKNFGGFLADEMWAHIFNSPEIQESEMLSRALRADLDFESVYSAIVENDDVGEDDKARIRKAVVGAYKRLDDAVKDWEFNDTSPYPVCTNRFDELLQLFKGPGVEKGLFFTLNQDLLMERKFNYVSPGAPHFPDVLSRMPLSMDSSQFVTLPLDDIETKIQSGIQKGEVYIKLHGSYGWKASDGSDQLVIGKNKNALILKEPLLKTYFDIFKQVIVEGSKKILIIGYSFSDKHINDILIDGIENHTLKIYVLDPRSPSVFKKQMMESKEAAGGSLVPILDGLSGYFPYMFKDIFPANMQKTIYLTEILEALE